MTWERISTAEHVPADPIGEALAATLSEFIQPGTVEISYSPAGAPPRPEDPDPAVGTARGEGPPGCACDVTVRLARRVASVVRSEQSALGDILGVLPGAALRAAATFRSLWGSDPRPLSPPLRRALRDTVAAEVLTDVVAARSGRRIATELVAETIDFLIELSGSRVESQDLTHGVVITDVLRHAPRLEFAYPADVRTAKRAPLLFDGRRSALVVDLEGRARTELQRHRFDRLAPLAPPALDVPDEFVESGSLVAEASRRLGGIGFFLRGDRSVWAFVDGDPLLVRRGEHWTAFPLELPAVIGQVVGGGPAARIVVAAAFMISGQRDGAILAIVDAPAVLDGIVSPKDRYDLRDEMDPTAMRTETRLHHLIDAEELDEHTLARLAILDGATILDREAHLLAYGAIVTSADSQHEGARTAAAKTLSETALVVLKISADGDITVFRDGAVVTTLLGQSVEPSP